MKEHPIPQDITNYRFHIIGNMTLKQFTMVGVGCVIAIAIYGMGLPSLIEWPLIIFFIALGAGSAFVPIQERPLDHWIVTFFRVMYKPTQYFWKRQPVILAPFLYKPRKELVQQEPIIDMSPVRKERIKEFMASIKTPVNSYDLDYSEQERIKSILETFQQVKVNNAQITSQVERPSLGVRVRKLGHSGGIVAELKYFPVFTADTTNVVEHSKNPIMSKPSRTTEQIAQVVSIPKTKELKIATSKANQEEMVIASQQAKNKNQVFVESKNTEVIDPNQAVNATFNASLPFPAPPSEPNKLVGMVLTPQNELIPGAIIELVNENGRVARAVKTNALGQFFITTPLKNGRYVVGIEKAGLSFTPQEIVVDGKQLAPMEIHSR